jgi:cysteinyl-tRNA synthetase
LAPQTATSQVEVTDAAKAKAGEYLANFNKALCDDLSTPRALAELWGLLKDSSLSPAAALAAAFDMDGILGLNLREQAVTNAQQGEAPAFVAEIERLIEERALAKSAKDYQRSDAIRQGLKEKGILLEDSPAGTSWRRA